MFQLIKKMFIKITTGLVNGSTHTKCISISNKKCDIQPTLINLHSNECRQELHYYPLVDVLEAVILLMTYLIKYVFQIKQKI